MMSKDSEWNLLAVIEESVKELDDPNLPPELVKKIYKILQKYQYRTNRDRPRDLIARLIESHNWGEP
ncbi:hypothetical protein OAO11_03390 [Candidatus Poseidoniaceae archaeon]|jgi:hypothetical protein|nr:hypothetical protein [Candidatus Poseidoniaceae archaeon]